MKNAIDKLIKRKLLKNAAIKELERRKRQDKEREFRELLRKCGIDGFQAGFMLQRYLGNLDSPAKRW